MNLWLAMLLGGLLTFATRLSFILLLQKVSVPDWVRRALLYVPIAVLSAIIFPEVFLHSGTFNTSLLNPRLLAAVLAIFVAWKTRNALLTVACGMAALWIIQALF
jgi:branched-subunit amino acid transport protein